MTRSQRRFARQLDRIAIRWPRAGRALDSVMAPGRWWVRLPLGLTLMVAGLVGFLPVAGFWMLPLGLVLLAIDLPALRPATGALVVRFRALMRRFNLRL